jgi:hypothetical protein
MQNARLIFDSFNEPAVVGLRGSSEPARQLAYQYDSATINLLIQHRSTGERISLAGQVLDVSMRAVHGLPVGFICLWKTWTGKESQCRGWTQ